MFFWGKPQMAVYRTRNFEQFTINLEVQTVILGRARPTIIFAPKISKFY